MGEALKDYKEFKEHKEHKENKLNNQTRRDRTTRNSNNNIYQRQLSNKGNNWLAQSKEGKVSHHVNVDGGQEGGKN